jgi:nitrite reductase/ring-hydroxylating ferredoxin subunit
MPAILDVKPEKDFMIIQNKNLRLIFSVASILISSNFISCKPDLIDAAIPYQPFPEIHLNLNLPVYIKLRSDGGYIPITSKDGGVQGIIVYRLNSTTFLAYERNCSYHPNDACATVEVHSSGLYMIDPCCNSSFDFASGNPTGGPAWRPLRRYETLLTVNDLTITDNIVQ